jgi:large subunit ribosomal protein L22
MPKSKNAKTTAEKFKSNVKGEAFASATLRHVRISPQKVRLVLGLIRGKEVDRALDILRFAPKKGAEIVSKLLKSAVSNAREKGSVDVDELLVSACWADPGRTMKRYMPRARGMATPILKRSSHITLVLGARR